MLALLKVPTMASAVRQLSCNAGTTAHAGDEAPTHKLGAQLRYENKAALRQYGQRAKPKYLVELKELSSNTSWSPPPPSANASRRIREA